MKRLQLEGVGLEVSRLSFGTATFLVRSGLAVELSEKVVILADVHKKASEEVLAFLDQHGRATASDLRQHLETSRRVIMPLLERMDAEGKTRRDGDYRSRARE